MSLGHREFSCITRGKAWKKVIADLHSATLGAQGEGLTAVVPVMGDSSHSSQASTQKERYQGLFKKYHLITSCISSIIFI